MDCNATGAVIRRDAVDYGPRDVIAGRRYASGDGRASALHYALLANLVCWPLIPPSGLVISAIVGGRGVTAVGRSASDGGRVTRSWCPHLGQRRGSRAVHDCISSRT